MAKREIPEINAGSMADIAFLLLIFFLVTTTMDKDTAYLRQIPKILDNPPPPVELEDRNVCAIQANELNELMVRKERMDDPDKISEKIVEFYKMNRGLNKSQTAAAIQNRGYKGFNFPFYSYVTKSELEANIDKADAELEAAYDMQGVGDDYIDFKAKALDEWTEKYDALNFLRKNTGTNTLQEIHSQAHIRVEVMAKTKYELLAKIHSEIEEAFYELKDEAAEEIFGESYGVIKQRRAMDKEDEAKDQRKLDLLEVLYPTRIIEVTPN